MWWKDGCRKSRKTRYEVCSEAQVARWLKLGIMNVMACQVPPSARSPVSIHLETGWMTDGQSGLIFQGRDCQEAGDSTSLSVMSVRRRKKGQHFFDFSPSTKRRQVEDGTKNAEGSRS